MTVDNVLVDAAGGREFRLIRPLGAGGFGAVYLAEVRSAGGLQQQVAIKLLRPDVDARNQGVERLRDEGHVLASLRHPVILAAHDLVSLGDRVALVTEYVEGQDLRECMLDRDDPVPLPVLVDVVGQVAGALDAAWRSAGIVHRDIKPHNIRIGRHGNVKLMDFGIAISEVLDRSANTQGNIVMGSLSYLAPERFDIDGPPHPASDVFALGCVLFEGTTRSKLFHRLDARKLIELTQNAELYGRYISKQLSRPMPDGVRELLERMFVLDPDARIGAAEVAHVCDRLTVELPGRTSLRMWCRQRRWPDAPGAEGTSGAAGAAEPSTTVPSTSAAPASQGVTGATATAPSRSVPPRSETSDRSITPPPPREALHTAKTVPPSRIPLDELPLLAREGSLSAGHSNATLAHQVSRAPAPRSGWLRLAAVSLLGASGATVAGVAVLLLLIVGVLLAGRGWSRDSVPTPVPPLRADRIAPQTPGVSPGIELEEAEPEEAVGTVEDEATAPRRPQPPERPPRAPAPAPPEPSAPASPAHPEPPAPHVAESPAPAPPAAPEPVASAPARAPARVTMVVGDDWPLQLRSSAGSWGAGEVPPGDYDLLVKFGQEFVRICPITLASGDQVTVDCNGIKSTCKVMR